MIQYETQTYTLTDFSIRNEMNLNPTITYYMITSNAYNIVVSLNGIIVCFLSSIIV